MIKRIAREINIPFTVGGGISSVEDIGPLLDAGADKVSINSAAFRIPDLIPKAAKNFGSQCIVAAVDAKRNEDSWEVFLSGGRVATGADAIEWIETCARNGAGEILLTSMNADGTKAGFDIELCQLASSKVSIPIIASGGAGNAEHFLEVFEESDVSAGLAASIFHFKEVDIKELKRELSGHGIEVR